MLVLGVLTWSVGCLGCYRQVVPPPASISQPQLQPPILEAPVIPAPQEPEVQPVTPITKDNPWKPETAARDWKYIVLHHTASDQGDVESIHESHLKNKDKNGKPWLGIGYHFVIGNGKGMNDGEIEPTFRWKQQMQGAHAGVAEYNQLGIGIVLVGNFENGPPTAAQVTSVKRLVRVLSGDYEIKTAQIVGHGDVKATECPGTHFPLSEIRDVVAALEFEGPRGAATLPTGPVLQLR
ncbi:MAG: N-acetylmuramoyl-L-alanine amidase [Planctomycetes bacterium]|nr:N-acetylmuramoyl-L-alanine amidase [Planctomycetota bacterium]